MADELQYSRPRTTAAIRAAEPSRRLQLAELATLCGCAISPFGSSADVLLADLSSVTDRTNAEWSEIADYLDRCGAKALVWIGIDQIDNAFAALPASRCHFLIDEDDALAVSLLARVNGRAEMDQLHDNSRDGEYRDLQRMSDELAGFARTLARIAEQDEGIAPIVSDKPVGFRAAPSSMFEPLMPVRTDAGQKEALKVRNLIKLRRLRDHHFDASLFADPGWDILLDLYAAKMEGKSVSVSSLCIAAAVPPTTGLRWITTMTEHGVLVRRQDPNDARRVFIELSKDSENRLRAFFSDAEAKGGLPI